jgi:Na+/H+ antiporter NhaD/arsenite permease-like protein
MYKPTSEKKASSPGHQNNEAVCLLWHFFAYRSILLLTDVFRTLAKHMHRGSREHRFLYALQTSVMVTYVSEFVHG